jgi:hypothetical protein
MKVFAITAGIAALLLSLGILLRAEGIWETKTFGVAEQNAQTQVYEQSQSHIEGTRRDLEDLYLSYLKEKDPAAKQAILSVMRHRAQGAPADQIPADVKGVL